MTTIPNTLALRCRKRSLETIFGVLVACTAGFFSGCGNDLRDPEALQVQDASETADVQLTSPEVGGEPDTATSPVTPQPDEWGNYLLADALPVTFQGGVSDVVEFDVPAGIDVVMFNLESEDYGVLGMGRWLQPDGSVLVPLDWVESDPSAPLRCAECPNPVYSGQFTFSAMAPSSRLVLVQPGTHRISFRMFPRYRNEAIAGFSVAKLTVYGRRTPENDAGALRLNFYFADSTLGIGPAQDNPQFQQFESRLAAYMQREFNITLLPSRYREIGPEFGSIVVSWEEGNDLQLLLSQGQDQPDGVNVFFVDDLRDVRDVPGAGRILGIAGGIPGPAFLRGRPGAGVVIAAGALRQGNEILNDDAVYVVAHELGHYLGLFHVIEAYADIRDPFSDTYGDLLEYLMYPFVGGNQVSPMQAQTVRQNLNVMPIPP